MQAPANPNSGRNAIIGRAPPAKFYGRLRFYIDDLLEAENLVKTWSVRQIADYLGIPRTTYRELREFIAKNRALIEDAKGSNDPQAWKPIEAILFAGFGRYESLASYKRALEFAERGPATLEIVEPKNRPGRPKGSKNKPKVATEHSESDNSPAEGGVVAPRATTPAATPPPTFAPASPPASAPTSPPPAPLPPVDQESPEALSRPSVERAVVQPDASTKSVLPPASAPASTPAVTKPTGVPKFGLVAHTQALSRRNANALLGGHPGNWDDVLLSPGEKP